MKYVLWWYYYSKLYCLVHVFLFVFVCADHLKQVCCEPISFRLQQRTGDRRNLGISTCHGTTIQARNKNLFWRISLGLHWCSSHEWSAAMVLGYTRATSDNKSGSDESKPTSTDKHWSELTTWGDWIYLSVLVVKMFVLYLCESCHSRLTRNGARSQSKKMRQ